MKPTAKIANTSQARHAATTLRDTADAEGFVHVHAGIHGGGGLDPAMHDWHNPTARLEVKTWKLTN